MSTFTPDSRSLPYRKAASRRTAWSIPDAIVAFIAFSLVAAVQIKNGASGHPWLAPTMFIALGVVTTLAVNLAFGIYTPRRRLPVRARSGQLVGAAAVCTLLWMVAYIFGIARFVAVPLPMAIISLVCATVAMISIRRASDVSALVKLGIRRSVFSRQSHLQ